MRPEYLADLIDRFHDAASAPLVARVSTLEAQLAEALVRLATIKGEPGEAGPVGKDGRDGIDGRSVTAEEVAAALDPRIEAAIARAVLDVERRAQGVLERAVERMPKPADGKDGTDGIPFESLEFVQEDERNGYWIGRNGDRERRWPVKMAGIIYRGIWDTAAPYEVGDVVTFGGSSWIARAEGTGVKPGGDEAVWQLMVKRGRDLTK